MCIENIRGENPLETGISYWTLRMFVHVSKQEVGQWCASMMIVPAAAAFHCLEQLLPQPSLNDCVFVFS